MLFQASTAGVRGVAHLACEGFLSGVESLVGHKPPLHVELLAAVRAVETRARALSLATSFAVSGVVGLATVIAEKF